MRIPIIRWLIIIGGFVLIAGCRGTVQVGIERTPTPDRSIPATLTALQAENNRLATRVAEQTEVLPNKLELGQLAYVQGGDIWIKPLLDDTVGPLRLTTDGYNREPRWSPSGKWLAYRKERQSVLLEPPATVQGNVLTAARRQVWVIQSDGNADHPLNQGLSVESFAWSPTGERLAYTTPGGGLYIINADGTGLITLVAPDTSVTLGEQQIGQIMWSPDGRSISYEWRVQPISRPAVSQSLRVVPAEGGLPLELVNARVSEESEAALVGWSALGDEVLFVQDPSSVEVPVDGGQLFAVQAASPVSGTSPIRLIEDGAVLPYADVVAPNPTLSTSPESESLVYVEGQGRRTWTNKRIKSPSQDITADELAAISPSWSPQGDQLAFAAMPDRDELTTSEVTALLPRRIYLANAVGDPQLRALTNSNTYRDERPLWSSRGDYLLFARFDARGRASLWLLPSGGGVPLQVVDELTPAPDPYEAFGLVSWDTYYDWWRGP
jgi:Tol biopolymer transport system component